MWVVKDERGLTSWSYCYDFLDAVSACQRRVDSGRVARVDYVRGLR